MAVGGQAGDDYRGACAAAIAVALSLPLSLSLPPAPAHAAAGDANALPAGATQDAPIVYLPADFAQFAPRSALDMVEKLPDFRITEVSADRGMGQASENVLVNGERVSGKANDARTQLGRIAAASVERIEIIDGATLGIPGLTGRVANVVVRGGGIAVQFRWDPQFRRNIEDQLFTGSISASGRIGASDFTLSLSNATGLRRGGIGREVITDAAGATLVELREHARFHADAPRLSGSLHRGFADSSVLNLNLSGQLYLYEARLDAFARPTGGPAYDEWLTETEDEWNAEGGADYEFPLGAGRLKLIALQRFEHSPTSSRYRTADRPPGDYVAASRFDRVVDEGESVLRAEYGWTRAGGGSWQLALEGAYNFIDVTSGFSRMNAAGALIPQPLPGGDTFVDEWRAEATATRGWTLARGLTLQATLGGEYSRIRQTSAGGLSRSFARPKGSAAIAWQADRRWTVNARIERRVGQLSFYDFSTAINLHHGTATNGNARLAPDESWRMEAEAVRTLGSAGSVTLGGYGEWISDIVDRVPLSATEEGIGNLPSARRWGLTGRGTVMLDALGWRGARIDASGEFRRSRVRDPLIGSARRISDDLVRRWQIDLRHDIPATQIAWGGTLSEERYGPVYRLDQISSAWLSRPIATLFVEHKDVRGLTVRLSARNLLDGQDDLRRTTYLGRRDGPVDFRERQLRRIHVIGLLSISGGF